MLWSRSFRRASREGSTLISHLIAQYLLVLHLRLVLNNFPSENDSALIAGVNRRKFAIKIGRAPMSAHVLSQSPLPDESHRAVACAAGGIAAKEANRPRWQK